MKEKYFTPHEKSLRVGTICQLDYGQGDWRDEILTRQAMHGVYNFLDVNRLRMKYLDKEDFKEMGWEYVNTLGGIDYYKRGSYNIEHYVEEDLLSIYATPTAGFSNNYVLQFYKTRSINDLTNLLEKFNTIIK